jgi:DNA-binding ferritin-like protein
MEKELLSTVLQIKGQLKILHWQTESYAEHKAFEKTYKALSDHFDKLIEVCISPMTKSYPAGWPIVLQAGPA